MFNKEQSLTIKSHLSTLLNTHGLKIVDKDSIKELEKLKLNSDRRKSMETRGGDALVSNETFGLGSINSIESKSTQSIQSLQTSGRPLTAESRNAGTPEKLEEKEAEEYFIPVQIFGEKTIACVISPYFAYRQNGLTNVIGSIPSNQADPESLLKATFQIILFISNDNREKSHGLYCDLLKVIIGILFLIRIL